MLELLKPSLPGAARALADMARFRLQVALTPSARQPALLAQRFMTPTRRDKPVSASAVMADLQRFAPDWASRLAVQGDLPSRVESLFERMHTETLATPARDGAERLQLYRWTPPRGKATPARHALLSHGWESYIRGAWRKRRPRCAVCRPPGPGMWVCSSTRRCWTRWCRSGWRPDALRCRRTCGSSR